MGLKVARGPREGDFIAGHTVLSEMPLEWLGDRPGDWSLVYTASGGGSVAVAGAKPMAIAEGSFALIAPGRPHRFASSGEWEILWFHFLLRPHMKDAMALRIQANGLGVAALPEALRPKMEEQLRKILLLDMARPQGWKDLACNLLEGVILRSSTPNEGAELDPRVGKALEMMHAGRASGSFSAEDIAARCGISRSGLFALFKSNVGATPHEYFETLKLETAKRFLERTSLSVGEVAKEAGFPSIYYFSARFKKATGKSPRSYRQAIQKSA